MLRFLMPYLVVGLLLAAAGGALYGSGAVGLLGAYVAGLRPYGRPARER
jgi:hypothetical protein